jgi:predicted GNAT family acetyltransferase
MRDSPTVIDNLRESRFELETPSGPAVLEYRRNGKHLSLVHTEVPEAERRRGIATRLVEGVFLMARKEDLKLVPVCPFVRAWVERHPEVNLLLDERP